MGRGNGGYILVPVGTNNGDTEGTNVNVGPTYVYPTNKVTLAQPNMLLLGQH